MEGEAGQGQIVIQGLGLEKLAELVLDGMKLGEKPGLVVKKDGGNVVENEPIMYATRDAFLCFEIGLECLKMIGHRTLVGWVRTLADHLISS